MIRQNLTQRLYTTDTYGMGGWTIGRLNLQLKAGVKGLLNRLDVSASGLPDSLGLLTDKSSFGYLQL